MANSSTGKAGHGYGKPPEKFKWKKGQSGNPSGRKKAEAPHLRIHEYLARELLKLVTVTENGKSVQIPVMQFLARQFLYSAAKGKPKEILQVLEGLNKFRVFGLDGMFDEEEEKEDVFSEEDRRLIALAHREAFGK